MTKCQKDPTCGIFLKRGFSELSMYYFCIVSASSVHHQRLISASSAHHQYVTSASSAHHQRNISASSVHHCSLFIAELSPVYCCLVDKNFVKVNIHCFGIICQHCQVRTYILLNRTESNECNIWKRDLMVQQQQRGCPSW